jgi:hypothetical protein
MVLDMLAEAGLPGVVPALATPANCGAPLGQLLADALREHRQGRSVVAAAAATEEDHPELPVPFVEELPPVEAVLPAEVLQPAAAAAGGAGSGGGGGGAEVVQAEFSEVAAAAPQQAEGVREQPLRQPEQVPVTAPASGPASASAAAAPAGEAEAVPLDLIDSIVEGREAEELDSMDSEELLAAARQALGLDDGRLQRMVDDAAAAAAAALNVPFVPGEQPAGQEPAAAGQAAAEAGSSGGAMPWNSAASQQPAPAQQRPRGFAAASGAKRAAPKAKAGGRAPRKGAAQAAGGAAASPAADAAAQAAPAAAAASAPPPPEEQAPDNERPIPPVERFILSRAQLKAVTDQHGLDFEEILAGLASKGIQLAD